MGDLYSHLLLGFTTALTLQNLLLCFIGCLVGTLVGVLPGVGPIATIAMLLPLTFKVEPTGALIMLAGIYYGAQYGGSTTAILAAMVANLGIALAKFIGFLLTVLSGCALFWVRASGSLVELPHIAGGVLGHVIGSAALTGFGATGGVLLEAYDLGRTTLVDLLTEQRRYLDVETGYTEVLARAYDAFHALPAVTRAREQEGFEIRPPAGT